MEFIIPEAPSLIFWFVVAISFILQAVTRAGTIKIVYKPFIFLFSPYFYRENKSFSTT